MSAHATFLQRRPLAEARALLLAGVEPVEAEEISVDDATGRVAAETVTARHSSPHYRASAMDGIAVHSRDTWSAADAPVVLRTLEPDAATPRDGEACCVAVDTGSLLPDWADAVVRIEDATTVDGGYRIKAVVPPGRDVRRAGEDIDRGTVLVPAGARIRAWDVGAMLATGTTSLRVRRRPRVAILATGSEIVEPGGDADAGRVIEYNSRVAAALVEEWGGSPHRLGIAADDAESLARTVRDAADRFDVACVIAGSSAGRKDLTVATLASLGEVLVHGVDISPGRPAALARIRTRSGARAVPVIAVPGYPVAAIVVCEQFLRPLVAALLGSAEPSVARLRARVARKIPSRLGMEEFRRVCVARGSDGRYVVAPLPAGAGSISTVAGAHGWLRIDASAEGVDADAEVEIELLTSREDIDAAFIVAGEPCEDSARLEQKLRGANERARVLHLRLGPVDALAAVERGEAHAAFVANDAPTRGLTLHSLAGIDTPLATASHSAGDAVLRSLEPARRQAS